MTAAPYAVAIVQVDGQHAIRRVRVTCGGVIVCETVIVGELREPAVKECFRLRKLYKCEGFEEG